MRFASLDHFGIDQNKLLLTALGASATAALAMHFLVGSILGSATIGFEAVVSGVVFYIVATAPRRMLDSRRISQAREAVLLSAVASASTGVTGSRTRTFLLMRSRDEGIAGTITEVKRMLLLGRLVEEAVSTVEKRLVSYSVVNAIRSAATTRSRGFSEAGEETLGLAISAQLSQETKLPIFMTACFFSPIMLLLYAVFSHLSGPVSFAQLVALEFVILDLAFYLCSGEGLAGR
jgi:hypothetical protein